MEMLLTIGFSFALPALLALGALMLFASAWSAASQLIHPPCRPATTSPLDYGLEFESISFPARDGLTLRGWFIQAPDAQGTIVLCHGYAGDCSPDLIYAPLLHEAGFNTLFFDFRGHGASDGTFVSLVYFERGDLLAALDFLRARGITRVGLFGFSMGGAIAIATAPQSPLVVGIVSDCAFAELHCIVQSRVRARGFPSWLAALLGWLIVACASIRLRANLFSADPLRWVDQVAPRPLLIMHAENDADVPAEQARRLYAAARAPKELWIVPNAIHRAIEDVARDEYRQRVIDFFSRAFAMPGR